MASIQMQIIRKVQNIFYFNKVKKFKERNTSDCSK